MTARALGVLLVCALVFAAAPSAGAGSISAETFLSWSETLQVAHVNSYVEAVHNLGDIDAQKYPDSHVSILRRCLIEENVFPRVSIRTVTALLRDRARAMPKTESVGPEILIVLWDLCEKKGSAR